MTTYSNTNLESIVNTTLITSLYASSPVVSDSVSKTTSLEYTQEFIIAEKILLTEPILISGNLNSTIINSLSILSNLFVQYENLILESIVITDSAATIVQKLTDIVDSIKLVSSHNSIVNYKDVLQDILNITSTIDKYIRADVLDYLIISNSINELYKAILIIGDSYIFSTEVNSNYIFIRNLDDYITTDDISSTYSILNQISSSLLEIRIGTDNDNTYLAYLLSPETMSVSNYNNYNFNGCTKFGYKYLFYNKTGLYEHGGSTDNGTPILSEIETVAFNFNTSNLKQVPAIYLGVDSTDKVILKVRVDGKAEVHYQLNKFTNNLMTQKIDIGKGLIGRYFQFELITEASEFNMESIEFYPLEIRRKL